MRSGALADIATLGEPDDELCIAVRAPEVPEGALFAEDVPWRFAVLADPPAGEASELGPGSAGRDEAGRGGAGAAKRSARAPEVLVGECSGPEELVTACAQRSVVAHDAKALGKVPPSLVHDTLIGAYLLDPARRGYPLAELCEERGLASEMEARPCCWRG